MVKEDVKKAFEYCISGCPAGDCPYYEHTGGVDCFVGMDALDLINEQEQEIDKLRAENEQLKKEISELQNEQTKFEIEVTSQAFSHWYKECENQLIKVQKQAKEQSVKGFAEMLETILHFYIVKHEDAGVEINTDDFIDKLLKEYGVEEEE